MTTIRVWGYATDEGDMALTADREKARAWKQLFRERGEPGPFEFVLTPSVRTWHKSEGEIQSMKEARAANKELEP